MGGYQDNLEERARLIVKIPEVIKRSTDGKSFPAKELINLEAHAILAQKQLDTNNHYGMACLLTTRDSNIGEPNELQKLINRVYPPEITVSK